MPDLLSALRAVRDAGNSVGVKGWAAAGDLTDAIQSHLPILQCSHDLAADLEQERARLSTDCETWLRISTHAKTYPDSHQQRTFGIAKARALVVRIDALLGRVAAARAAASPSGPGTPSAS